MSGFLADSSTDLTNEKEYIDTVLKSRFHPHKYQDLTHAINKFRTK